MCETTEAALDYASLLTETVSCKRAAIVIGFFTYLIHQVVTGGIHFMEHQKKDEKVIKALKGFKLDIEQRSYFYMVFILFIQILTPVPFGVAMIYLYFFISFPLIFMGHFAPEKWWRLRIAGIGLQVLIMVILILFVLINPWCRQYYFRYVVANP